jgi:hypothetical protein
VQLQYFSHLTCNVVEALCCVHGGEAHHGIAHCNVLHRQLLKGDVDPAGSWVTADDQK